jgi:ribosomal protein S18 acetylase RimI-like enzyme
MLLNIRIGVIAVMIYGVAAVASPLCRQWVVTNQPHALGSLTKISWSETREQIFRLIDDIYLSEDTVVSPGKEEFKVFFRCRSSETLSQLFYSPEGRIIGALLAQEMNDLKVGYIAYVVVDQEYRRLGIAQKLMHAFATAAKSINLSKAELSVKIQNQTAIRAYEQFGFRIDQAVVRTYYSGTGTHGRLHRIFQATAWLDDLVKKTEFGDLGE